MATLDLSEDTLEVTNVESLFTANIDPIIGMRYDVSSDGQRFVINTTSAETNVPISLVTNWTAELEK